MNKIKIIGSASILLCMQAAAHGQTPEVPQTPTAKTVFKTQDFSAFSWNKIVVKFALADATGNPVEDGHNFVVGDSGVFRITIRNTSIKDHSASLRFVTTSIAVDASSLAGTLSTSVDVPLKVIDSAIATDRTLKASTISFTLPIGILPDMSDPASIPKNITFGNLLDAQMNTTIGALVIIKSPALAPGFSLSYNLKWKACGTVVSQPSEWTLTPLTKTGPNSIL